MKDHNPSEKERLTKGVERAAHRALLYGLGLNIADLHKPLIGIVNSWTDLVPGHMHLNDLAAVVREGIAAGGGTAREFHTCAVCDGLAQGHGGMNYSLPSRDNIADTVEIMARAHCLDGLVLLCGCDKIVPGQLMAALRLNLPTILVTGGCMEAGRCGKHKNLTLSSMREMAGAAAAGRITADELTAIEMAAIPGAGSCAMLGTANTMCLLGEALGMTLPGMGAAPARSAEKLRLARASGERAVSLVKENCRARDVVSREALLNAITVDMALGGSTNSILHLLALAHEAGVHLELSDFDRLSAKAPHLCDLLPGGKYPLTDFYYEGGMPALLTELAPLLRTDLPTVNGKTLAEQLAHNQLCRRQAGDRRVIHSLNKPLHSEGGLAVLFGNLAPEGAVIKTAAVSDQQAVTEGPALPFDCMEDAVKAALEGKITQGSVVVVRYEGPAGGPGMREMHMLSALLSGMNSGAAVVTDGRFSGSSRGVCVGHVSPEAATGGLLALVEEGDLIRIDIPGKRLELLVEQEKLYKRKAKPPQKNPVPGLLQRYRKQVGSASQGAITR
jgi:dihydroxy-acid dehydratase